MSMVTAWRDRVSHGKGEWVLIVHGFQWGFEVDFDSNGVLILIFAINFGWVLIFCYGFLMYWIPILDSALLDFG